MLQKYGIFVFILIFFSFFACAKKSDPPVVTPPQQPYFSDDDVKNIKNQISEAVRVRLVPCDSDGFRYAIYKGEIIKISHLQITYGDAELLQEVQKANGALFRINFKFVKSSNIPKGEKNEFLYKSYDPTDSSWSDWKVLIPQSFTAEIIADKQPSIPEFYGLYAIPRDGFCQAIKDKKNLGEFLKSDFPTTSVSPTVTPSPEKTVSSKEDSKENESVNKPLASSPSPTPKKIDAKNLVLKFLKNGGANCPSGNYLIQSDNYPDGYFHIIKFSTGSDNLFVESSSEMDRYGDEITSISARITGGTRYEWKEYEPKGASTSRQNNLTIDINLTAELRNNDWILSNSSSFKPVTTRFPFSCDEIERVLDK